MRNEIQVGRLSQILARLLSMDEGAPSPTLATDIFPCLVLESDRPEWAQLGGVRLCGARRTDAAVAGQYSHVALRNPTDSGVIVVVRSVCIHSGSTAYSTLGIRAQATLDATTAGFARDSRWSTAGAFSSKAVVGDYTAAVQQTGAVIWMVASTASTPNQTRLDVVLSPGFELLCTGNAVNVQQSCAFEWYERPILPSETR